VKPRTMNECQPVEISDEDVADAMRSMQGYIDITVNDFREVYRMAYALAVDRIKNALKAEEIMTRPVIVIPAHATLMQAARILADNAISGAPVVDSMDKVVGVVSEKDFITRMGSNDACCFMEVIARCLEDKGCLAAPMRKWTAADIMSAPAVTATQEVSVSAISALLMEKKMNRLPIVDLHGRAVGIVTRSDLVQSYCFFS
jgi:CBS domain-containing membrane protein